jgi:hypothetical protein
MAIDPKELRVNYRDLLSIPIRDRTVAASSGALSPILDALTPTQRAQLFPRYFEEQLPDISGFTKAMSGGLNRFSSKPATGESDTYGPLGKNKGPGGQRYDNARRSRQTYTPAWVTKLNKEYEGKDFLSPDGSGGTIGSLIASGEGGYNSYNRGRAGDSPGEIDFSQMTLGEVMAKQQRGELFAVGKYQVIPDTMKETVAALGLDPDQKFTPELQERIFRDYLIDEKRPAIKAYVTGKTEDINSAQLAAAQEFASVANPYTGRSHYDGVAGNSASISAEQMAAALEEERRKYNELIASGLKPEAAWAALSETNKTPEGEALALMPGLSEPIVQQYNRLPPGQQQAFLKKLYKTGETPEQINGWVEENGGSLGVTYAEGELTPVNEVYGPGRPQRPDAEIRNAAQVIATDIGMEEINFTSGKGDWISPERRAAGQKRTNHSDGHALDVTGFRSEEEKLRFIEEAAARGLGGIGAYTNGSVHIDLGNKRTWDLTATNPEYAAAVERGRSRWDESVKAGTAVDPREAFATIQIKEKTAKIAEDERSGGELIPKDRPFSLAKGSDIDKLKSESAKPVAPKPTEPDKQDSVPIPQPKPKVDTVKLTPQSTAEPVREDRAPVEPQPEASPEPTNKAAMVQNVAPTQQASLAPDAYSGLNHGTLSPSQLRAYRDRGENLHREATSYV